MLHKSQRKKNHRSCSRAHQGRFIGLLNNRFLGEGGTVCAVQRRFSLRWPKMGTSLSYKAEESYYPTPITMQPPALTPMLVATPVVAWCPWSRHGLYGRPFWPALSQICSQWSRAFSILAGDLGALRSCLRRGYDPQIPDGTGTRSARDPRGGYSQISGRCLPDTACNSFHVYCRPYEHISVKSTSAV